MGFAERYVHAVSASNLKDDEHHHQTDPLAAAAIADRSARDIGALLHRVKYANSYRQAFEGDNAALLTLRRAWLAIVTAKGRERKWIKDADWPTMAPLFPRLAEKVAIASLAHYLDGSCKHCGGSGRSKLMLSCKPCNGSGRGAIGSITEYTMNAYEIELARQMHDELMNLESSHAVVAVRKLRNVG